MPGFAGWSNDTYGAEIIHVGFGGNISGEADLPARRCQVARAFA
jgi:hypothetical protein